VPPGINSFVAGEAGPRRGEEWMSGTVLIKKHHGGEVNPRSKPITSSLSWLTPTGILFGPWLNPFTTFAELSWRLGNY